MEKLIKLLNEYDPYIQSDGTHTDNFWWYVSQWHSAVFPKEVWVERIISKSYWFIKWLVDNDKIDKKKIDTRLVKYVESHYDEEWYWMENSYEDYSDTNTLLMLLAIQASPLEFLISVLK